jgi:2-keto-4-pentenoate hydratase
MSLADGECARERMVALLAQPYGDPVGYKVGLTNDAAQRRFGVPHPLRGTIFHGTLRERSGAELPARFGAVPVIESDLLVRVRDEGIATAGNDPVAILRHLDQVIPFIELPDLVFAQGQLLDAGNLLAINVGARLGVVGTPIAAEATPEFAARLGSMTVILATDERELSRAPGTALLGHPLNVIPWLVQDLAKEGRRLRAGDYVSLGGFSPALPTEAGRTYTVRYEGLAAEPVSVTVRLR